MQYKVSNSHNQGQTASQISTYNFPVDINNSQYLPTDLCTSFQCHKTDEVLALKIKLLLQYRPAKISASRDENILFNRRARLLQGTVVMGASDVDCCCCFLFCVWVRCSFPLYLNISVFHLASLIISSLVLHESKLAEIFIVILCIRQFCSFENYILVRYCFIWRLL